MNLPWCLSQFEPSTTYMSLARLLQAPPSLSGLNYLHVTQLCPHDLFVHVHLQWCPSHYATWSQLQVYSALKCPQARPSHPRLLQVCMTSATIASTSITSVLNRCNHHICVHYKCDQQVRLLHPHLSQACPIDAPITSTSVTSDPNKLYPSVPYKCFQ